MNSVLIGYDLDKPGQDYSQLISAIQGLGIWWHCLDSTWIVKTNLSCEEIRNILWNHMDANDKLLVVRLVRDAAWNGFNKECSDWLQNNL